MTKEVWTVQRMLDWSKKFLEEQGLDSPALDAQILLGHVLKMSRMQMILDAARPMSDDELACYKSILKKRVNERQPVAYILGKKAFWSLDLDVTPDVLIPRPDTECLVEQAQAFMRAKMAGKSVSKASEGLVYEAIDAREAYYQAVAEVEQSWQMAESESGLDETPDDKNTVGRDECVENANILCDNVECSENDVLLEEDRKYRIVDVGTGSGAIALALRSELPESCEVLAVDISEAALVVARRNAEQNGLSVSFGLSDLLASCEGMFDLIVSNPPYITTDEMLTLDPEVKNEPKLALEAGVDGLDVYRRLIPQAFDKLSSGGGLFVEIGCSQGEVVSALFRQAGFVDVQVYRDYGRNPRVVSGVKAE